MHAMRYFHTVRHLKPRQLWGQVWHRVRAKFENRARFPGRGAPAFPGCRWRPLGPFLPPGRQDNTAAQMQAGTMCFVNQTQEVGWPPAWNFQGPGKLWAYNLHYFEWLWAFGAPDEENGFAAARTLVRDWMEQYPIAPPRPGWDAYPISLRLMNWCAFFLNQHRAQTLSDAPFAQELWASIWLQAEWLSSHLEEHLLGNHLMENAAALALTGACFEGADARRWHNTGTALLREQLAEQMLADGLHFERSPMYHSRVLYLLLALHNTGDDQLQDSVKPWLAPALQALAHTTHPDGEIALLNDSAFGIYNPPGALADYARRLGLEVPAQEPGAWALPEAGYFGFREAEGNYILCDAGAIGPDYIPGHAHADTFSFELSLRGHRVLIDSGVHDYEWSEARRHCRSTAAHNTVEIDGADQSEVWGAFRVARRAYPRDVNWKPSAEGFSLTAWHDGYLRLPSKARHRRTFDYTSGGTLQVEDMVAAARPVTCRTRLHLHPDCACTLRGENGATVTFPAGQVQLQFHGPGQLEVLEGRYHPEFHTTFKNTVLCHTWTAGPGESKSGFTLEVEG